jgi:para-aminobenzoate synthetase component 2
VRLLLIDNFDSFVYNLAQAFGAMGAEPVVMRNDSPLDDLRALEAVAVVVSPGPGGPADAGVSIPAIKAFASSVPVLGVCLGHQCIVEAFGGRVVRAPVGPVHGKTSSITHDGRGVFEGVESPFVATRYHSLAADESVVPAPLSVTAHSDDGVVMGVRHDELVIEGVQFHPESVMTESGSRLLANFLAMCA